MELLKYYVTQLLQFVWHQADVLAALALTVTVVIFVLQQRRANRIEKQENYLRLELASNDLFRFEAEKARCLRPYRSEHYAPEDADPDSVDVASAYFFMTLDLFEISVRMRRDLTIGKRVFGSWVVWYYDTLCSGFFRTMWPELRENYTPDLREIFDQPVAEFSAATDELARKHAFFEHVAVVLDCPIIREWLPPQSSPPGMARVAPVAPAEPAPAAAMPVQRTALGDFDADGLGRFFAACIQTEPAYISHTEYFEGLSTDGTQWAPDLEVRFRHGLGDTDSRDVFWCRDAEGALCAAAIVRWSDNGHERYGVIEDMAVATSQRRAGLGQALLQAIKATSADRGVARLLLESGINNHGAHGFFARSGFEAYSKTFCLELADGSAAMEQARP